MLKRFLSLTLLLPLLIVYDGWGQVNITAGSTITQNFNDIGSTATSTLPTGWKMDRNNSSVRTLGTYTAAGTVTDALGGNSISSSAGAGMYNFGAGVAGSASDRAIGGLSSGSNAKSVNSYVQLKNNGTGGIASFTISYKVEKYRNGSNSAGFSIQMYYSTDGSTWTNAGSNFLTSFTADADNNGFTTAPGATTTITDKSLNISLAANSILYLAWNYSVTTGTTTSNAQALGIDDVSITAVAAPAIAVDPTSLAFGNVLLTDNSVKSYALSGSNLTSAPGNIRVTAPTGYQVSLSELSGYDSFIDVAYTSASLSSTTVYVKFSPSAVQSYNGSITHSGGGVTSQTLSLTGNGVISDEPTNHPSYLSFTDKSTDRVTVNWTSGNGANRIVIMKKDGEVSASPSDGAVYTANSIFETSGTDIGSGNYAVYNGSGNSVIVTGLSESTTYHVAIFEYNGSGIVTNYLTSGIILTGNVTTSTPGLIDPPLLTADAANNNVDNDIEITFTDANGWQGRISDVKIAGESLNLNTDYNLSTPNKLILKPSGLNPLLTTAGVKSVIIIADGFNNANVSQSINAGEPTNNSTAAINPVLALNSSSTVTLTAKDQFNNLVSGYAFKFDATITDDRSTTDESYTIDGNSYTSSATDVVVSTLTNASGVATFGITVPAVVDANDGINVRIQLSDGSTNVGDAFSFGNTPGVTITGTDPGTGKFTRSYTQQVLYRYEIAVTNASVTLNQVAATLSGSYKAEDLGSKSLKLYYSANNTLDGADPQIGTSINSTSTGSGENITFTSIGKTLPMGTSYVFLTTDISYEATIGRTISGSSSQNSDITFAETVSFNTGSLGTGNLHEIIKIAPSTTDLIISEYIEGSSNNKYIEIFNGTGESVSLTGYSLRLFANGSATATNTENLSGTLENGKVLVFKNSSASLTLPSGVEATVSTTTAFNGDDAIAIYNSTTLKYVDIFGRIGSDPGAAWTSGSLTTLDKTLRRKSNVSRGVSVNPGSGFPTLGTEWDQFDIDIVSGLGSHTVNLPSGEYSQSIPTGSNNYAFIGTGVQINFVSVTTGATVTVTRYEGGPTGTAGISESNVSNFRWVIEGGSIAFGGATSLRFKASSLTGIVDPTSATIKLYKRSTPGSGNFTLVGTLTYDAATDEFFVSGITGFSEFVMASESQPLPVELTSFTAKASGTTVALNWETKTEVDNNGFEVERNATGTWQKIGFVEGHGTANSPKYYSFSDANPLGSKIQYRLKQIDNDGSFEYSPVVEVEIAPVNYTLYQNYPNPFNPSTVIRYALPVAGMVTIDVFNALGEKVSTLLNGQVEAGFNQVSFDATNLPSGLYFYRIQSGDFTSIKKMLLMK